ncbi:cysteine desulfurase family protein [Membranihabitans marinus]|uniref:cysteine desulfurase family protein n=1 Tax=Membranihabitans marinus TaxID=1227546 RepID=UPI001F47DE39|nr:cysteine desulfurase family protein [Membranihabitans marinus]
MASIYFDNAASAPLLDEVAELMVKSSQEFIGNPSSTHKHGRICRAAIERARKSIAQNLKASIGEIFFTSGGTESNNSILNCAVDQLGVTHIISSPIEHPSVLNPLTFIEKYKKVNVQYVAVDGKGKIDLNDLQQRLKSTEGKVLVSIMHANNETGAINPIAEIGQICKEYQALYHTDAVQTVGHLNIDVSELNISFLSASGHKFHGPKGIGFMYVNSDNIIEPFIRGGSQERNVRAGTENITGILGMAHALDYCIRHMEEKRNHVVALRQYFIDQLHRELPQVSILSPESSENGLYTVLNILIPHSNKAELLLMNLDIAGISASGGSACSSGAEKPSHVIANVLGNQNTDKSVRFSFSFMNQQSEVDYAIEVLKKSI